MPRILLSTQRAAVRHAPDLEPRTYLATGLSRSPLPLAICTGRGGDVSLPLLLRPGRSRHIVHLDRPFPGAALREFGEPSGIRPRLVLEPLPRPLSTYQHLRRNLPGRAVIRLHGLGWISPLADEREPSDLYAAWQAALPELFFMHLEGCTPDVPLLQGVPASARRATARLACGAHLHLHYAAVWPELRTLLDRLPEAARILVTVTDSGLARRVREERPGADVREVPNRGRDIAPFLDLLRGGAFDGLDAVCKLHSKMTLRDGRPTYLGKAWRRQSYADLAGSASRIEQVLDAFANTPGLGALGPGWARMPNARIGMQAALGCNAQALRAFLGGAFPPGTQRVVDFFAGSMFWFRPGALRGIEGRLAGLSFPRETGNLGDCTTAHMLERAIPSYIAMNGYQIRSLV